MKAAVFFATREGHTRKVAERVAAAMRAHGVETHVIHVKGLASPVDWSQYAMACVAASVHVGHHEREMVEFARRYREPLTSVRAAFLSVSLSEAGAEDVSAPLDKRQQAAADARRMIEVFIAETGWRPARTLCVAGALAYTRYNFLVRFLMKRIARKQGASTDTSRDHEFTDWKAIDGTVSALFAEREAARTAELRQDGSKMVCP